MDGKKSERGQSRLDFKNPDHRKTVAQMLRDGYSYQEIAERFGYKYPRMINLLLHREGGVDSFLANTIGSDAARHYLESLGETRSEHGTRGVEIKREGDLVSDVSHDPSFSPREGLHDPGAPTHPWYPPKIAEQSPAPKKLAPHYIEKHRKAQLRTFERAARVGRNKEVVKAVIDSLIAALRENSHTKTNIPVFFSTYMHNNKELPSGKQKVLVMRTRRLTVAEATEAGDRGKIIDEFIGTLKREIDGAKNADSTLGATLRERGFDRVDLQIMYGTQPITLSSTHLR